jgi:hypothetical protein
MDFLEIAYEEACEAGENAAAVDSTMAQQGCCPCVCKANGLLMFLGDFSGLLNIVELAPGVDGEFEVDGNGGLTQRQFEGLADELLHAGGGIVKFELLVLSSGQGYQCGRPKVTVRLAPACFLAGTLVQTDAGLKRIENIEVGERVLAYDNLRCEWVYRSVVNSLVHQHEGRIYAINVGGEIIEATGNHPFWVISGEALESRPIAADVPSDDLDSWKGGRWVAAQNLRPGDWLRTKDGKRVSISTISSEYREANVYNLTIEDLHNYVVSGQGVLVHNKAMGVPANWTHKVRTIANKLGRSTDEIDDAIHGVKDGMRGSGPASQRNPDVEVDTVSGDVRIKGTGDIIGNIFDHLQ